MNIYDPIIRRFEKNPILTGKDVSYPVDYGMSEFKTDVATVEAEELIRPSNRYRLAF